MKKIIVLCAFFVCSFCTYAQSVIIDEIIATVGNHIITRSDLEYAIQAYKYSMGYYTLELNDETTCNIIEQLLFQKLLLHQAELDSIVVTDQQVNDRLDYNIRLQVMRMGGDSKKLEEYYGKSIAEIKAESREQVREDFLAEEVQRNLTANISIAAQEVKDYFQKIPKDSLPIISTEYEMSHIVKTPIVAESERIAIKERLESYRSRILRGENFSTFARMYSEDPGSASKGGDIGFTSRGELYAPFETAAYALKPGEISSVVETEAGFHIIKMIERRGEDIHVAHILIKPKPSAEALVEAKQYLDSVYKLIVDNHIPFDSAARMFSDNPDKVNGGKMVNPYSATYAFPEEHLKEYDKSILYSVENIGEGNFTRPMAMINDAGNQAYHIVFLSKKRETHKADFVLDYEKIKNAALEDKKQKTLIKWVHNKVKYTHIKIKEEFDSCDFFKEWGLKTE